MNPPLLVGPYRLRHPIGRGASGVVWAADDASGAQVAIKLLTSPVDDAVARFRDEVRLLARLAHPGVVPLIDQGVTAHPVADLPRGTPWLAMARADGSLSGAVTPLPRLVAILDALLDALAHVHARGILHLDLKPENVLWLGDEPALSDFGIAELREALPLGHPSRGTLRWMAPEQLAGDRRDYGPGTDLYAIGCLAWTLACGAPPFAESDAPALLGARRRGPAAGLPGSGWPAGWEAWLVRLLAPTRRDRFEEAADARRALALLCVHEVSTPISAAIADDAATIDALTGLVALPPTAPRVLPPPSPRVPPPPLPASPPLARTRDVPARPGLYRLREPALVGRAPLQEALWTALGEAITSRTARVVLLEGPSGAGRSRVAAWAGETAAQTGAAAHLAVTATAALGGLEGAVRARLRIDDATAAEALATLRRGADLPPSLHGDVVGWLIDGGLPLDEARATARAVLAAMASRRPLVLTLDDVHRDPALATLARELAALPAPVLVIATAHDEGATPAPVAALRAVATALRVELLDPADHRALVAALLPLAPDLASRVVQASAGHPLHAVELVGHWVDEGALVATPAGWVPARGVPVTVPADLAAAWCARVDAAVAPLGPAAAEVVELQAVLDAPVGPERWTALGVDPARAAAVRDALCSAGLATAVGRSFQLRQGLLRDAIVRRAAPRVSDLHARCVHGATGARLARHLLGAGRHEEGVDALLATLRDHIRRGDPYALLELADQADHALDTLHAGPDDRRRVCSAVARACGRRLLGRYAEATACLDAVAAAAHAHGGHVAELVARERSANVRFAGRLEEAVTQIRLAIALSPSPGVIDQTNLALMLSHLRRPDEAAAVLDPLLARLDEVNHRERAKLLHIAGIVATRMGALDLAHERFTAAETTCRELGWGRSLAMLLSDHADVLRKAGAPDRARALLAEALVLHDQLASPGAVVALLNLALLCLDAGDLDAAENHARDAEARLAGTRPALVAGALAVQLAVAARSGRWPVAEALVDRMSTLPETGHVDPDTERLLADAARIAESAGHTQISARIGAVAAAL